MADLEGLEGLEGLGSTAEETTSKLEDLNTGLDQFNTGLGNMNQAAEKATKDAKTWDEKIIAMGMTIGSTTMSLANLANQMDALNLQHQQFDRIWKQKFLQFENTKIKADLGLKSAEIAYNKLKESAIETAKINKEMSDINLREIHELTLKEADLKLDQAILSVRNAELSLESAQIKAAMAELDYKNQLMSIEGQLINARKAAADAEKNYAKEVVSLLEPWVKLDDAAAAYTKTIGGSAASMQALKKETFEYANASHLQAKYNISAEELIKLQTKYNSELGRSVKLTNEEKEGLGALKKIFGDEKAVQMATSFTNFGYDINRASGLAGKLFANASKYGISADKMSKNLLTNIKMAQTLTFAKGVKGLQEMAARATELNFNMQETAKAADKLSTLEGALNASAQLSVLGGNFAQFSNPLAMMNEALNDSEALQERIVAQFSDLAHWDSSKGEISMDGQNRIRMKTAAQAMGMDPTELSNMVFTKARQDKLSPEIDNLGLDDDLKHLLKNVAQLDENGRGFVNIGGKKTSLEEASTMNPEQLAKILRTQNNSDSDNIKEIAQAVTSINDRVEGYFKAIGDSLAEGIEDSGVGRDFMNMITYQSTSADYLKNMTDEQREAYMESAKFNEKNSKWTYEYQGKVNSSLKELARISRDQTILGEKSAEYGLLNAKYGLIHAQYDRDKAPLRVRQEEISNALVKYGESEAKISLAHALISLKEAQMTKDYSIPLQEEQLKLQYQQAKRINDLYEIQRLMMQMQAIKMMKDATKDILGVFGPVGRLIGRYVGAGFGVFQMINSIKTMYHGDMTGQGTEVLTKGKTYNPRDYNFNSNDRERYTGGGDISSIVSDGSDMPEVFDPNASARGDRGFATGGLASISRIGGVIMGPSHAEGGINIKVEGGEYIMPVEQTKMYRPELEAMRSKTFPVGGMGGMNPMKVENYNGNTYSYGNGGVSNGGSMNLTLNGTIKLELSGNTANIDAQRLLENDDFLRAITSSISSAQINRSNLGVASNATTFSPMTT